jgi:signal transduction histidine kinase
MMSAQRQASAWLLALGAALAAAGALATATSPFVHGPLTVVVVAACVFIPFAVAAELRARYPDRVLAALLVAVGLAYFVRSLAAINSTLSYAPARAVGQVSEVLLVWLMLAFPSGRLPRPWSRALVIAAALIIALLWWPLLATSSQIPSGGVFVPCGAHCPANALLVSSTPGLSHILVTAFRVLTAVIVLATAGVLAHRLRHASRVMRRVLTPVLLASIARTGAVAAYMMLGSTAAVRVLLAASYLGVPLAIILGLLRGRAYDAAALERLVTGLRARPGPAQLRSVMSRALQDPTLQIVYWLPEAGAYAGADGLTVELAGNDPTRAVTHVADAAGEPVAALSHDPALLDHPRLLDALASTAALALETNRLEAAVAAARAGTITAVDAERRRIERDLHDGTQQRLIALRMKLSVAERILGADAGRAQSVLDELGGDIDSALAEVRSVSHGIAPPVLVERGLADALAAMARVAPVAVQLDAQQIARYPPHVETAVYFCCLEALQNVAKHGGAGVSAKVEIRDLDARLAFAVSDDGRGFDFAAPRSGSGLNNIAARVEELGGTVNIQARRDGGTRVSGSIPLPAAADSTPPAAAGSLTRSPSG